MFDIAFDDGAHLNRVPRSWIRINPEVIKSVADIPAVACQMTRRRMKTRLLKEARSGGGGVGGGGHRAGRRAVRPAGLLPQVGRSTRRTAAEHGRQTPGRATLIADMQMPMDNDLDMEDEPSLLKAKGMDPCLFGQRQQLSLHLASAHRYLAKGA